MSSFELFIDDDRYSVPTLRILATDKARALALAKAALAESAHHLGVELYGDDRRVLGLGSLRHPRDAALRGRVSRL